MILKGGKRIFLDVGGFPVTRNATWKMFSSQKITFTSLVWFVKKSFSIINKIIVNNFFCPKADYWFVSGNKPANIIKSKKKIYAYNLQYDQYLKIKNSPINNDFEKSIVYIDQNYEGHIDFILDDLKPPVNKFTHWESLNKFLTSLNRKLGKKIIIAAHPRRSKKDKINTKFEVVFNQTANIIKNSSLVVTHDSTAIAMAVLFKKPILFVIMDKLARTRVESFSINDFAKSLNKDVINIDDSYSLDNIDFFRIDENVYKKYFEDFIKSPYSKFTNYWVDFINYLEVENVKK